MALRQLHQSFPHAEEWPVHFLRIQRQQPERPVLSDLCAKEGGYLQGQYGQQRRDMQM